MPLGIQAQVHPEESEEYREITKNLEDGPYQCFTYKLSDEKTLVVWGIPKTIPNEEIQERTDKPWVRIIKYRQVA